MKWSGELMFKAMSDPPFAALSSLTTIRIIAALKQPRLVFFAILCCASTVQGSDTTVYLVRKGFEYTQTTTALPTIDITNGYSFEADVIMPSNNTVTNASIQPPAPQPLEALTLATSQSKMDAKHKYNSQTRLDSHYPNGTYVFTIDGRTDGLKQPAIPLAGNLYPNSPHIQNFTALQSINPHGYFLFAWDTFSGGNAGDIVQLRIDDLAGTKIFETPDIGKPGALDGTATHTLIGPGVLPIGSTNQARLLFQKAAATNLTSYPGALGQAAFSSRTAFRLATTTTPAPDIKTFEIYKARKFLQTESISVAPESGQEFVFDASAQAYNPGVLNSGTLQLPSPSSPPSRTLVLQPGGTKLDFSEFSQTQTALDALYSSGNYTLQFGTSNDGPKSLILPLPAGSFPPAPRISNFDLLQTVNVSHPVSISWDPWPTGGINDFIQIRIEDHNKNKIYETPDLGLAGALYGRATNAILPAGALPPGKSLEIHLTFKRIVTLDTTNYPGVLGVSSFQARTKFTFQTIAADVGTYTLFKKQAFQQTDAGAPANLSTNSFSFECHVSASTSNSVTSASITPPSSSSTPVPRQVNPQEFALDSSFGSQTSLDTAFANGAYSLTLSTLNDGTKALPLVLQGDAYPNAPHLLNFYAAELIDNGTPFTLNWDAFVTGTANDFVQLLIRDLSGNVIFQTPAYGFPGALTGLAVGLQIPASTLESNKVYSAELMFRKQFTIDTTTYPGALGLAGYTSITQFKLATKGPGNPALLTLANNLSSHLFELSATTLSGFSYRVDGSTDLVQWSPLATNTSSANSFQWQDPVPHPVFFYRLVMLP